jgi:hypothetical protein
LTIRRSVLIAIITAVAVGASGIAALFLIVPATSYNNSPVGNTAAKSHEEISGQTHSWVAVKDAAVHLQIENAPEQQMIESGLGSSIQTTFLPISITYTMTFANPTKSFVFY